MDADLSATPARDARPCRTRGQFSLRGLLWGLTLVTLLLSHVYTSWQLYRARAENSRLRTEVGELEIEDPDQLNVVALSTIENMTWKWRAHVPAGQSLKLRLLVRAVPQGVPQSEQMAWEMPLPGQYTLTAAIRKDHLGKWQLVVDSGHSSARLTIGDADAQWLETPIGHSTEQAGKLSTEAMTPGQPFVLLRVRGFVQTPGGSSTSPTPGPGVMLWIDDGQGP